MLCILAVIPTIIAGSMETSDYYCGLSVGLLLFILAIGASCIIKTWMLKIENTSEYNKTTDLAVGKNLIEQRGIYNEV